MMLFADTNILLSALDRITKEKHFYISSVTFEELENIKTDNRRTEELRYSARKAVRWLEENEDKYTTIVYDNLVKNYQNENIELNNDAKILACANMVKNCLNGEELTFISNDVLARHLGKTYFKLRVESYEDIPTDEYKGYLEECLSDEEMAYFYEHINENMFGLLVNQYVLIKDSNGNIVDKLKWDGEAHQPLYKKSIKSIYFDKLKPKDVYQECAIDSLMNNTITAISGKAGSGKSLLSLMAAMNLIESGKYSRLVVMFNPVPAKHSASLGFYKGDFLDKAKQSSIGQILTTKFGDSYAIDVLIAQNKLKLVSMADARGMEISDNEILWITEASNTNIELIKLCLTRVSSGAKVFIEGDYEAQVDLFAYEGDKNGLKRVIDVFKGYDVFGYIQLQNVWRSKIAELCDLL